MLRVRNRTQVALTVRIMKRQERGTRGLTASGVQPGFGEGLLAMRQFVRTAAHIPTNQ